MQRHHLIWLALVSVVAGIAVAGIQRGAPTAEAASSSGFTIKGRTQPLPDRHAAIAPTAQQEVVEVRVKLGDTVKEDQILIKLADDEAQAELQGAQAKLAEYQAKLKEMKEDVYQREIQEAQAELAKADTATLTAGRRMLELGELIERGAVAVRDYEKAKAEYAEAQQNYKAAQARIEKLLLQPRYLQRAELQAGVRQGQAEVEKAKAHIRDTEVHSHVSGVVIELTAYPGLITRPGTTLWGEVADLKELDVRCLVTPEQASRLRPGQTARVDAPDHTPGFEGSIVYISKSGDRFSGLLPVLVRFRNPELRVPCYVEVPVTFLPETKGTKE